jgi:hypothetical protein
LTWHLAEDRDDIRRLGDEAAQARRRAIEILQGEAKRADLQAAARELGGVLLKAAQDKDFWSALRAPIPARRALSEEQRMRIRTALDVDWSRLLDEVGYVPPPPSQLQANELKEAIERALEGATKTNVKAAHKKLMTLGTQLVGLGHAQRTSDERIKSGLRKGVRVAGRLTIVAGVAAGGAALVHVAAPAVVTLGAVGAAGALETVKEGAKATLAWALDRAVPEKAAGLDEDRAPHEALAALKQIEWAKAGHLVSKWETCAAGMGAPDDLVVRTRQLVDDSFRGLYRTWEASIGAAWSTAGLRHDFDELQRTLSDLMRFLDEDGSDRCSAIAIALERAQNTVIEVMVALGQTIGHD